MCVRFDGVISVGIWSCAFLRRSVSESPAPIERKNAVVSRRIFIDDADDEAFIRVFSRLTMRVNSQ